MDEETGGSGSNAYTAEYAADFPHYAAAIESDSGAAHPLGFDVKASAAAVEALRPVQGVLMSIGASVLQLTTYAPGADITAMSDPDQAPDIASVSPTVSSSVTANAAVRPNAAEVWTKPV